MERGYVSGGVHVRPARCGLVAPVSEEAVSRAVELACTAWGGAYFPLFDPGVPQEGLTLARRLSVDFFHPVLGDPPSGQMAESIGFRWRGGAPWGPFDDPGSRLPTRLLSPGWLLPHLSGMRRALPSWDNDDPLGLLLTAWYGRYDDSGVGSDVASRFAEDSDRIEIGLGAPLPDLADALTPIGLTRVDIEYTGDGDNRACVVVLDPQDVRSVVAFWNLRACDADVFPWPLDHEDRIRPAFEGWINHPATRARLGHYQDALGQGRYLAVWNLLNTTEILNATVPEAIAAAADRLGVHAFSSGPYGPEGWTDVHPMTTEFRRTFNLTVDGVDQAIRVPIPAVEPLGGWRGQEPGIVAVDITVYQESLRPGFNIAIPQIRALSALLNDTSNTPEPFHRPGTDGRTLGVRVLASEVELSLVPSMNVMKQLVSPWTCSQSDSGRFATRMIELLGGPGSSAGNQPSIRAAMELVARSPVGKPVAALIQRAKRDQGPWPEMAFFAEARAQYPTQIVYWLLSLKIFKPVLPLRCPHCATATEYTAEELSTTIECGLCSETFPLGLAVATSRRADWLYRLAANVSPDRIAETLPIMAAMHVLSTYRTLSPKRLPHVLGLGVNAGAWSCEVDIAAFIDDGGPAVAVVGEVKGGHDSIDDEDVLKLGRVQDKLRGQGIECLILAATLRERLAPDEIRTLRALCERSIPTINPGFGDGFVAPIILTRADLSAPRLTDAHPTRWVQPGDRLVDIAIESCRRNLGLVDATPQYNSASVSWHFEWTDSGDDGDPNVTAH